MSLALWLRAGRAHRGMSLDDVAKVTKIQPRILERLEAGKLEGLPAEVFVRGFVRSFARCVGLDEEEALRRYAACGLNHVTGMGAAGAGSPEITPAARALVEAMADLVPGSAIAARATPRRMTAVEVIDLTAGSLRDLPSGRTMVETMVETMMLPETGTVVVRHPPEPPPSLAEAMTDSDTIANAAAGSATSAAAVTAELPQSGAVDALPPVPAAATADAPPVALVRVDDQASQAAQSSKKKRGRRGKGRNRRPSTVPPAGLTTGTVAGPSPTFSRNWLAVGTPAEASPVVIALAAAQPSEGDVPAGCDAPGLPVACDAPVPVACDTPVPSASTDAPDAGVSSASSPSSPPVNDSSDEPIATATWAPKMPPMAAAPSVPWRKPAYVGSVAAAPPVVVPSLVLVIDDADPDSAERIIEERAEKHAPRRSFLPPILLDREDRSARQGGLTLAVIILLIAATLTLSYLMRRPSAGGDGMTRLDTPSGAIDVPAVG